MDHRAQNRPMKNQEEQENRSEADEKPADPTSPAMRLDCPFCLIVHEGAILREKPRFSTGRSCRLGRWTNHSRGLLCISLAPAAYLMTPETFFDYLEGKLPPREKERLE